MFYEFKIALKTIRQEGFVPLIGKIFSYFGQLAKAVWFLLLRKPLGGQPVEVVDFSFNAAGGLIRPYQVRSEFLQVATLFQQRKPRVVV